MIRILVVDDDVNVRESVVEVLQARGYQTLDADGADDGLSMALRHSPDLVVSDIMMPGKDGYTLLSEFRDHQATAAIPFILMTGVDNPDRYRAGMDLGADDYLPKPFTGEQLHRAVKASLRKHRLVASRADEKVANLLSLLENTLPHELRTPLNGILGFSEMLKVCPEKFSKDEVIQAAEYINVSAKRLHRLVENVLLSARLRVMRDDGCGIEELKREGTLNLVPLLASIARDCAERYDRASDLSVDRNGELMCHDPQLICKAFEELVDNAFKFSNPDSGVKIVISHADGNSQIVVEDSGRGMRSEQIARIDLFRQFDRSHFEQQGAGLGLFIAKQIVNELGGSFAVDSQMGQGTTITLGLPALETTIDSRVSLFNPPERMAV